MRQTHASILWTALFITGTHAGSPVSGAGQPFACERIPGGQFQLDGPLAEYIRSVTQQWLRPAPNANLAMLEMFRDRDRRPFRALEPWAGEFAGKHLTAAVQVMRLTDDPGLKADLATFVGELIRLQDVDGYIGPWPKSSRLTGSAPNVGKGQPGGTWDAWGHYHVMLGLLMWHEETGDENALAAARKIGDLFCNRFLGKKQPRLVDTGSTEMNLAPIHGLCLLFRKSRDPRHLEMAKQILAEFAAVDTANKPLAGDYLRAGIAGKEFHLTNKPRWESLHPLMGLAELHSLTGDAPCRNAFEHFWWSIVRFDRPQQRRLFFRRTSTREPLSPRCYRNVLHHRLDGHERRNAKAHSELRRCGRT